MENFFKREKEGVRKLRERREIVTKKGGRRRIKGKRKRKENRQSGLIYRPK